MEKRVMIFKSEGIFEHEVLVKKNNTLVKKYTVKYNKFIIITGEKLKNYIGNFIDDWPNIHFPKEHCRPITEEEYEYLKKPRCIRRATWTDSEARMYCEGLKIDKDGYFIKDI